MSNTWFETVAEAQRRAKKRLPGMVYGALVAGSERGRTISDNTKAFGDLGFAPRVVGHHAERDLATTIMGVESSFPVLISPTGVQAVDPEGEVAVARAAANRGVIMGLSSFASRSVEDVCAANPNVFYQMYWTGSREAMTQRMERAKKAGAEHVILNREENVPERVREITDGAMVPVVYDGVGKDTFQASIDSLQPFGLMVSFGNASGPVPPIPLTVLKGSLYLTRPSLMPHTARRESLVEMAGELFKVVGSGKVRIEIDQRYELADAVRAHQDLEARRTTGSTILLP